MRSLNLALSLDTVWIACQDKTMHKTFLLLLNLKKTHLLLKHHSTQFYKILLKLFPHYVVVRQLTENLRMTKCRQRLLHTGQHRGCSPLNHQEMTTFACAAQLQMQNETFFCQMQAIVNNDNKSMNVIFRRLQ